MSEKRIVLADADQGALTAFCQALGDPAWEVRRVASSTAALSELESRPCDILLADLDLPGGGGAQLLNDVRQKYPQTVRFILAEEGHRNRVMQEVLGAHQFLSKPFDRETLQPTLHHALEVDRWIASPRLRDLVGRLNVFPTVPDLYMEVLSLLKSPATTTEEIGGVIARDIAMMTKMLQVINSAYFGLPRKISDPAEAVGILGFETIKSMVMSIKFLSQYSQLKPVYFSVDHLWLHSTETARIARDLTILQTQDRSLAAEAFTAGLLHDLGKLVFAANFDEQYAKVYLQARQQQTPLWQIEKEVFGASHGEMGAYLFGLWGLPMPVLEAVAWHHEPARSPGREFCPLAAVHVANTLQYEIKADQEQLPTPLIDEAYLAQTGCAERLFAWREAALNRTLGTPALKNQGNQGQAAAPILSNTAQKVAQPPPARAASRRRPQISSSWLYAAAAAVILLLLALVVWFPEHPSPNISFDDLRLDGVIFTSGSAYAIINGQTVGLHGQIAGATVQQIGHTNVIVEYQHRQRILNLK